MAKDRRPIAVQVEELTAEQRKNVLRIGVWGTVVSLVLFAVILLVALLPMFEALSESKTVEEDYYIARDAYDEAEAEWEENRSGSLLSTFMSTKQGAQLWKERTDAMETWNKAGEVVEQKLMIAAIALGVYILVAVVGFATPYKKFPYYSDRKCCYILFHRKSLGV